MSGNLFSVEEENLIGNMQLQGPGSERISSKGNKTRYVNLSILIDNPNILD